MDGHCDPEVKNRLRHVAESGFKRISYTEAIDILLKAIQDFKPQKKGEKLFEFEVRCFAVPPQHACCTSVNVFCNFGAETSFCHEGSQPARSCVVVAGNAGELTTL